ncbi:MAG: glutamate-5-semialdehyde dehydrogenase [Rhodospirillales bacterium]|nr:glutamate-5-semialdehyde dehydrogenase [Rhodospirillales bacterium]
MVSPVSTLSPTDQIRDLARSARESAAILAQVSPDSVNLALSAVAENLRARVGDILRANRRDMDRAKERNLAPALCDRLMLDEARVEAMARGVETVRDLPDPIGSVLEEKTRPNGLVIRRVRVPIGLLGMIFESRPNVTVDAAALCLKSHNAVLLRGGSESIDSCLALHAILAESLRASGLPESCVSMIPSTDRALVGAMLGAGDLIDVMIPRGGKGLIARVMAEATMPVFSHLDGICHIYIHPSARTDVACAVTLNAKMRRTGICGAVETLLMDEDLDRQVSAQVLKTLLDSGCTVVGDEAVRSFDSRIGMAEETDWTTEYLDAKISVRMVKGVAQAVDHINRYGSHHTDGILAEDPQAVDFFLKRVDSAIVIRNASTQFADGGEFGMGAEIGIATGKFHARGPVGVEQLTTYKYEVLGSGQIRA